MGIFDPYPGPSQVWLAQQIAEQQWRQKEEAMQENPYANSYPRPTFVQDLLLPLPPISPLQPAALATGGGSSQPHLNRKLLLTKGSKC